MELQEAKVPLREGAPLKQLNMIAKRPSMDIEFQDLLYSVRDSHTSSGKTLKIRNIFFNRHCI